MYYFSGLILENPSTSLYFIFVSWGKGNWPFIFVWDHWQLQKLLRLRSCRHRRWKKTGYYIRLNIRGKWLLNEKTRVFLSKNFGKLVNEKCYCSVGNREVVIVRTFLYLTPLLLMRLFNELMLSLFLLGKSFLRVVWEGKWTIIWCKMFSSDN